MHVGKGRDDSVFYIFTLLKKIFSNTRFSLLVDIQNKHKNTMA